MRTAFDNENIQYSFVPPHNHRANAAERAIQTFKNHFISGLSGVDPQFPIKQWDRLLEQATITLNLLRASRLNPRLSAYAYVFGNFNFTSTPLAPPGTRVVAHTKPTQRSSWSPRGEDGWYIGPSMQHHRCVRCYFTRTRSERNVDTVTFIPHSIPFPTMTIDTFLRQAATDIVTLLKKPPNPSIPRLQAGDSTYTALQQLADLLQRVEKPLIHVEYILGYRILSWIIGKICDHPFSHLSPTLQSKIQCHNFSPFSPLYFPLFILPRYSEGVLIPYIHMGFIPYLRQH